MFRRVLILAALVLGCGVSVSAQGFRIGDAQTVTSALTSTSPIVPLQASVNVCVNPANAVPCTNKASTFTSVTLATPCSAATQVVLAGTTTCVAQTDVRGNWGAWVAAGNYDITFTLSTGQSFGPYTISVGIPSGTSLGVVAFSGPSPLIDIKNSTYSGGAKGDGATDDTVAIQAAVSACPATGGTVFFPPTANSYVISSKITLNTNCWYVGVGKASLIAYKNPLTDNYPKFFCNGGSNVVIYGINFSNAVTPTTLLLWTNSEGTINGQEGFFCLGCQDLEIHDNIFNNLGGAGILVVRGARERIHNNIANGNVRYGIYLLSDDNGTPTDDQIYSNTCSNNGSFGNSGFQGRGIVATLAGSTLPVIGSVNTKIISNTCNGNSLYGIEVYRGASYTEIGFNTTSKNGLGGIHEYNNVYSHVHDNNVYGNGLPNVPTEGGSTLPLTGYCVRQGGGYFSVVMNNDCHDNNFGGGNAGQIVVNGEGDFTGSFGNIVKNNTIRNNGGSGQDIFISQTANNSFGSTTVFYKVTAYDCSRNVLAQSGEVSKATSATSVNLLTWAPVQNACSYIVFRGATTGTENQAYIALANAFMDENAPALATLTPPGSGTTLTGLAITNFTTPSDTISTVVSGNIMIGSSTPSGSSISGSATYSSMADNIGTGVAFSQSQQGDRNGVVTCVTNTVQKVYQNPYSNVPTIILFDETTKGGANITAKDRFSFTVSCTGATDVVDYYVIPSPF